MIDISNNNPEPINFARVYRSGQRRIYMKVTEGLSFVDETFVNRRQRARQNKLKVGGYHFAHTTNDPKREAEFFAEHLGHVISGRDLRPCLDIETGNPTAEWAIEFLATAQKIMRVKPIIYSYGSFLEGMRFRKPPAQLWLASYGRDDGKEHPFTIPKPWYRIAAHQFASKATVAGVPGDVDISHVFNYSAIDIPKRSAL